MNRTPLAAMLLVLTATPALAQGLADLAAIDRAVAVFTPGAAPVDKRLRLAQCAAPLALSWYGNARTSVLVQCPDAGGWKLYVPVSGGQAAAPAEPAVLRGEAVTVAVEGDGFAVSQAGEALDQGAVGAWIRVRTAAAQPLRAQIVRPGLVRVPVGSDLP